MGIRNGLKGGTNLGEEAGVTDDWNDTFNAFYTKAYADNTGGSVSNTTTETDLASITITQNDLGSSFSALISASYKEIQASGLSATTFRLYVNGSVVKTQTSAPQPDAGSDESGSGFNYLASGLDSTSGNIIIKITAQPGTASSTQTSTVHGLTVFAINNNS